MATASLGSNAIITSASRSPFALGSDHAAFARVMMRKGAVATTVPSPSQQPEYAHNEKLPDELNASDIGVKFPSTVSAPHVPFAHITSISLRQFHTSACAQPKSSASVAIAKADRRVRVTSVLNAVAISLLTLEPDDLHHASGRQTRVEGAGSHRALAGSLGCTMKDGRCDLLPHTDALHLSSCVTNRRDSHASIHVVVVATTERQQLLLLSAIECTIDSRTT